MSTTLPDKPSELIRLALGDLRKIEGTPGYVVDMAAWYDRTRTECHVCLAGAVMASRFEIPSNSYLVTPVDFPENIRSKMVALNAFRQNEIEGGCYYLGIGDEYLDRVSENDGPIKVEDYTPETKEQFHADMQAMADFLETKGL